MKERFGVEWEFTAPWSKLRDTVVPVVKREYGSSLVYARKDVFDSNKRLRCWHVKLENIGQAELTTPRSSLRDLPKIVRVVRELRKNKKLRLTTSDGLHVHVGVSKRVDRRLLVGSWLQVERAFFAFVHRERRRNSACSPLVSRRRAVGSPLVAELLEESLAEAETNRTAFTLNPLDELSTVEFRLSRSSVEPAFVRSWVRLCVMFVRWALSRCSWDVALGKVHDFTPEELLFTLGVSHRDRQVLCECLRR